MVEDPGCYLLKIVQGAVAGQASRVDLRLGKARVEIAFDSPAVSRVRPQRLAELLDSEAQEHELEEVLDGLQAARHLAPGEVSWTVCNGRRQEQLLISRQQCRLGPTSAGEAEPGCRFVRPLPRLVGAVAQTASEHRLAYTRCRFAPVAVLVDNRPVNDPLLSSLVGEGTVDDVLGANYPRDWLLAERYLVPPRPGPDLFSAPGPACRKARVYRLGSAENTRLGRLAGSHALLYEVQREWDNPEKESTGYTALRFQLPTTHEEEDPRPLACLAALGISLSLEGRARVYPVRNGVALDVHRADLGCPGVIAVVSARGLTTEPGTLRAVEDTAWEERMDFLRDQVASLVTALRGELHLLEGQDPRLYHYVLRKLPH